MLPAEEAEERVGHAVGGVCPFAVNEGCDVYLDESLRRFDVVYPACGSSNSAIALAPDELAACTPGSTWVDVCKLPGSVVVRIRLRRPRRFAPMLYPRWRRASSCGGVRPFMRNSSERPYRDCDRRRGGS